MKKIWNRLPLTIRFILRVYLAGYAVFFLLRAAFLAACHEQLRTVPVRAYAECFLNGLRYDTATLGYCTLVLWLLAIAVEMVPIRAACIKKIYHHFAWIVLAFAAILNIIDIPYYTYLNTRMTALLFSWFSTPKILIGYVRESSEYYPYLVPVAAVLYGFYRLIKVFYTQWIDREKAFERTGLWRLYVGAFFIVFALVQIVAIRSSFSRRPLSWAQAFTTAYPVLNYAGLNSFFSLGYSLAEKGNDDIFKVHLMDDTGAIKNVQRYLGITAPMNKYPIARKVENGPRKNYNVIVIVMESLSCGSLGSSGFTVPTATPFLDSLCDRSLYCTNIFADGLHTANGMWSLFAGLNSYPSNLEIMNKMENVTSFSGIGTTLFNRGYETIFFCPHDANFDNMGGVMSLNGFNTIRSTREFLNRDFVNVWGISDHLLFTNSIKELFTLAARETPFLAVYLTISHHGPYKLPEPLPPSFHPNHSNPPLRTLEYADWSLKTFIDTLRTQPWFNRTVFVIIGDHGENIRPNYEINYYHKHIPLLFYAPAVVKPARLGKFGTQMDVFPTLMDILGMSFVNNTMGIDLLKEKRPCAYFSLHSMIGAIDDSVLLIHGEDKKSHLYKYTRNFDPTDFAADYPGLVAEMETYARSNLQTSIWLMKSKKGKYLPLQD